MLPSFEIFELSCVSKKYYELSICEFSAGLSYVRLIVAVKGYIIEFSTLKGTFITPHSSNICFADLTISS